jgi:glycerol-3-phosphate acyltransferase PlsY
MQALISIIVLIVSYLIGSIPFGLIIVRLKTGQDVRQVESGRTGGTNAMRAAGLWAGIFTALLDVLKAFSCVYLARLLLPGNYWLEVLAPVMAVVGHNYSIFLAEKDQKGRLHLRGGAGGAPALGGAAGLWFPILLFILPIGGFILFFIGYASLATISVPVICIFVFSFFAWRGMVPWEFVFYGIFTLIILAWALRPNFKRLLSGNERMIGYRAKRRQQKLSINNNEQHD